MKKVIKYLKFSVFILCVSLLLSFTVTYLSSGKDFYKANFFGFKTVKCISASMEDTIKTNAIVIYQRVNYDTLKVGDIIGYESEKDGNIVLIVHRIVKINEDNTLSTKGDNNKSVDKSVIDKNNYVGKIIFISKHGYSK